MTVRYDDGTTADADLETKARIVRNMLAENKDLHPIQTVGYFSFLGFLAKYSEFNAEVPPQSKAAFEERYFLFTGTRPEPHAQGYFPIHIRTEWDKWAPELRIYFPEFDQAFDLPPGVEIRPGTNPGIFRINNNRFWWALVRLGFRLGKDHNVEQIRQNIPGPFRNCF